MEKCTFCSHRLAENLEPACVTACPVDALGFENRGEPDTTRHPGFPEVGLKPGLRLTPKRRHSAPPEMTPLPASDLESLPPTPPPASVDLADEWPLLVFSLVASILVAWFAAWAAGSHPLNPIAFALMAGGALAVSTLHLGRPLRAWRAVLNIRHSWLSREIASFSTFVGLALVSSFLGPLPQPLQWLTVALGFTALFSIDMVYRVPGQSEPAVPHSAMTTLTRSDPGAGRREHQARALRSAVAAPERPSVAAGLADRGRPGAPTRSVAPLSLDPGRTPRRRAAPG
jgi:hypothetical protein